MATKIVSDNYGNRRRVSDSPDSTNLVLNANRRIYTNQLENKNGNNDDNNDIILDNGSQYDQYESSNRNLHICSKSISSCQEKDDGSMWFYIGPYKGRINFCPYCGYKARTLKIK